MIIYITYAAICVFKNAIHASSLAAFAEPAIKPNHPIHKKLAPVIDRSILCG
jgi:hypothetical protein